MDLLRLLIILVYLYKDKLLYHINDFKDLYPSCYLLVLFHNYYIIYQFLNQIMLSFIK